MDSLREANSWGPLHKYDSWTTVDELPMVVEKAERNISKAKHWQCLCSEKGRKECRVQRAETMEENLACLMSLG